jgi:polyribonucleotide nucleotidyltransferase
MKTISRRIGRQDLVIETGHVAKQANGAVVVKYGETVVLVTTVMSRQPLEDVGFLPLTVEYQERTYAAGKIPGGFFKREGRPTEKEILTARLTDRPIRPLFHEGFKNEVQIVSMVLSSDGKYDPDILSIIGASSSLSISDIPFPFCIGAVKVALVDSQLIINPTYEEIDKAGLSLIVAGTKNGVIMLEGEAKQVKEEIVLKAIETGYQALIPIIEVQEELKSEIGKNKKEIELQTVSQEFIDKIKEISLDRLKIINLMEKKEERIEAKEALKKELIEKFSQEEIKETDINYALYKIEKELVRNYILKEGKRVDGRGFKDLRDISCKVGILPRTHGSALFTRGQTQSLAVTTLGTSSDEQMIEALEGESFKKFMVHYNFPPFSVGEIKAIRGPGRREIGHGALAEKALKVVMPLEEDFPYTVRIVSDILESNGSSSMATVCGGSLSLMDAGVPISAQVAGIALGLVKNNDKEIVLTDIAGGEDHYGDMDFKIAGTRSGITTIQLDLKINGIDVELISKILSQSQEARMEILDIMDNAISKPREKLSPYAPRIYTLQINPDKIALLIGSGGKTIRRITEETESAIDIKDDGYVSISADCEEKAQRALELVKQIVQDVERGQIYNGKITRITNFGAFCEIFPGKEGLIHISEISDKYVTKVNDFLKVGNEVKVKVIGVDDTGKVTLSIKQLQNQKNTNNTIPDKTKQKLKKADNKANNL